MAIVPLKLMKKQLEVTDAVIAIVVEALEAEEAIWYEMKRGKDRRSPMFEFVKTLRDSEIFDGLNAEEALDLVKGALNEAGYTFDSLEHDDPELAFLAIWPVVLVRGIFDHAVALAMRFPVSMPFHCPGKFARFCSLCSHLQTLTGDVPILVPCAKFGKALEVEPRTITNYRRYAMNRGMLQLIEIGDREHGSPNAADKFRWIGPTPSPGSR